LAEKPKAETGGWVAIGRFGGPVGVKGLIRLNAFTGTPGGVFAFRDCRAGPTLEPMSIRKKDGSGKGLVVGVEGIASREGARTLQGKMIYANRAEFPPLASSGDYYQADLVGLAVADETGKRVGEIAAFHNFGAGQLMEIAFAEGRASVMVPFRGDVVRKVDLKNGLVVLELGPWL